MQNIVGLQSVHSVRMFEILKSYEYLGEVSFEVEFLKTVLELGEKYKLYADFRRYVIDKAREDLTKYCDIYFDYQEIKKSRKVNEIIFTIRKNSGDTAENSDFPFQNAYYTEGVGEEVIPILKDERTLLQAHVQAWWGITSIIFEKKATGKTDEDIKIAIDFTKEKIKEGKANNPAGVFLEALSKGYKTPKQQTDILKQENEAKKNQKSQSLKEKKAVLAQWQLDIRFISEELNTAINNKIRHIVEQDSTITKRAMDQVTTEFVATKRGHFVQNKSVEDFRQLPILREAVIVAIKSMHKDEFDALEEPFFSRLQTIQQKIDLIK
jgi:hypothetical protein